MFSAYLRDRESDSTFRFPQHVVRKWFLFNQKPIFILSRQENKRVRCKSLLSYLVQCLNILLADFNLFPSSSDTDAYFSNSLQVCFSTNNIKNKDFEHLGDRLFFWVKFLAIESRLWPILRIFGGSEIAHFHIKPKDLWKKQLLSCFRRYYYSHCRWSLLC